MLLVEKDKVYKALGLFIVIFMALSMIAAAALYVQSDSSSSSGATPDTLPQAQASSFDYNVSFQTKSVKDAGTLKLATITSIVDKAAVDAAVLKVAGVSKVTSSFSKTSPDSTNWFYVATITLKTGSSAETVANAVFDLNEFDQSQRAAFGALKVIVISAPASTIIHNTDLNIDRNFSFESTTLSALAQLATQPGDDLLIFGTMTVQGKTALSMSLSEEKNLTQEKMLQEYITQMSTDTNSQVVIDSNSVVSDANN